MIFSATPDEKNVAQSTYAESPDTITLRLLPDIPMTFPFDSTKTRYVSNTSSIANGYGSVTLLASCGATHKWETADIQVPSRSLQKRQDDLYAPPTSEDALRDAQASSQQIRHRESLGSDLPALTTPRRPPWSLSTRSPYVLDGEQRRDAP